MFGLTQYQLILILMATTGWIGITYESYARMRGWPVGRMFNSEIDPANWAVASAVFIPIAVGLGWYAHGLLTAGGVLLSGFFLAFGLTELLRSWVQPLWLALIVLMLVLIAIRVF